MTDANTPRNEVNDWNAQVIAEFNANDGKVAQFGDAPLVILHTIGAKSGKTRPIPLVTMTDDEGTYIFASRGGAPTNPDWLFNLRANPEIDVQASSPDGIDAYRARLVELPEAEGQVKLAEMGERMSNFKEYVANAAPRIIPALRIDRL